MKRRERSATCARTGPSCPPAGLDVLALVVVAYAHVFLALAGAAVALAVALRILTAAPWSYARRADDVPVGPVGAKRS